MYDLKQNSYIRYNLSRARKRFLPLSTFKIPNSLIALETGVIRDENQIQKWSGEKYEIEAWNRDLTFQEALAASCAPCYQKIARQVGKKRMKNFLKKFKYGNRSIFYSAILGAASILALFFGQRIAKDYPGAAVLVPYFILMIILIYLTTPYKI